MNFKRTALLLLALAYLMPSAFAQCRSVQNRGGGFDYKCDNGESGSSRSNLGGGQDYNNGVTSRRNAAGGVDFSNGVSCVPNLGGGLTCNNGVTCTANLGGGMDCSGR
jgi:hypothetical protein